MERRLEQSPRHSPAEPLTGSPTGSFVLIDEEPHFRISRYDRLEPFLVNLASDTDLWMFISSRGGLTAGRVHADGSLFPYVTSDQLHDAHYHTGPLTVIRIARRGDPPVLWEPFSEAAAAKSEIERNLYKNVSGNQITFEEIDHNLGLAFRYRWAGCDAFGWVRTATLENLGDNRMQAQVLDGLRNILPWGAPLQLYQQASNLVDAYKKSEVDPITKLGIFALTSGITDRPEALEVLRANTVWCCGLKEFRAVLSLDVLDRFRTGQRVRSTPVLNGRRGNYLVSTTLELDPGETSQWHFAADAGLDHIQIGELRQHLLAGEDLTEWVGASLRSANENLRRNVASADGLQVSGQPESWSHHFANVLFNNMRGGVFWRNQDVPTSDFIDFLRTRNRSASECHSPELGTWPDSLPIQMLRNRARETEDADLRRLSYEYLPLYFGRRHGDPSRPWNRFEIRVRDRNGEPVLHYEGNWRDIFQNWEALGTSFPRFLPSMVARFVNASTVDGFNPYRITRDGVDWEVPSPDDPWSNIGYWGDHQIVYLLRLLEAMERQEPFALQKLLDAEIFSYAEVPYRIKPYEEILQDSRATIIFDSELAARIDERVTQIGSDGKLVLKPDGAVYHVSLLEKLLVPGLSKLSNLIPEAGIWMNTQRPEWNDANNALGGGSVSVVTLCYLRRYLAFLAERLEEAPDRGLAVSSEVVMWFDQVAGILEEERGVLGSNDLDPRRRKIIMDALGRAFSRYRETVYAQGFSGRRELAPSRVARVCRTACAWVDHSIAANRRDDGLYHTYNQLSFSPDGLGVSITHLQEMLEGQVAVLSSGAIEPAESLAILEQLYASDLYRPDQRSFLLYPSRELPGFLEKNAIPENGIAAIPLLRELISSGDRSLLCRDASGVCRFHGDIQGARGIATVLDDLAHRAEWRDGVARDRETVLELFESVFQHRSYTGRSGAMYGYEGIGCIYWHMVAKLLLAVQETLVRAERDRLSSSILEGLTKIYFRVQSGIGYRKTVAEVGAFPTDPYSHTPPSSGVKQPGMTGQVKEEILTRLGELGVTMEAGTIRFSPRLIREEEFLTESTPFQWFDVEGKVRTLDAPASALAFTLCQVPVLYELVDTERLIQVTFADGSSRELEGRTIDVGLAAEIFDRSGRIELIRVGIPRENVLNHDTTAFPEAAETSGQPLGDPDRSQK